MCGVIGVVYEKQRSDLGRIAAELLKTLEYRGYDSTGAAIQAQGEAWILKKGVGAPSLMVHSLGIVDLPGQIACGQVRWATFGAVTEANSQPHSVRCKTAMYGAHNGNVTNCDALKLWLTDEGHNVLSDNDGEMVVHCVEHYFARELALLGANVRETTARRAAMRRALVAANARLEGSFAAVVVDPVSRCVWAVKKGSSLYFGIGKDDIGGKFGIASSDLSSVLKLTRVVIPMREGEFVEFDAIGHQLYAVDEHLVQASGSNEKIVAGTAIERAPVRSRLRAKDTALVPPFETFMDQEISAQEETCRAVIRLYRGGSQAAQTLGKHLADSAQIQEMTAQIDQLRDQYADEAIRAAFHALVDSAPFAATMKGAPDRPKAADLLPERIAERLCSSEMGFFTDLLPMARHENDRLAVWLLDAFLEHGEAQEFAEAVQKFSSLCTESLGKGGRLFCVCCGSSYNAARAAALFFNELAHTDLVPLLPGEFRERVTRTLRDGDLFIAVSQSGETKDLIDVMNDTIASGFDIKRIGIVNNVNSTLAIEKSDVVIPLRCGPEIAVPATKSFINQLTVFYCLALELAQRRSASTLPHTADIELWRAELALRRDKLPTLPLLITETVRATQVEVEEAAQLLCLRPSIHLLAIRLTALAREGALKIREVVLNHAEGFEGSEFKHGPNTILGFNTILGPQQVDALLLAVGQVAQTLMKKAFAAGLGAESAQRLVQALTDTVMSASTTAFTLSPTEKRLFDDAMDRRELFQQFYADYPLIYLCGPDERDVNLAVSQINTHKIRGSNTVVIAEEHPGLRGAASKPPVDNPLYRHVYISLPRTGDILQVLFSATVVLQRLALRMSLLKMQYLDRLGILDHGVHPDVPKNVSKSITVD